MFEPMLPPLPEQPEVPSIPIPSPMVYVSQSTAWEYKCLSRDLKKESTLTEDELNTLGRDGWEMSGAIVDSKVAYYYFKRLIEV